MKTSSALGLLSVPLLAAMTLSGCVTEEVGPTNFHTTAYIERDTPEEAPATANPPPAPIADDGNSSNGQSRH